jgi:hypothetical protein
MDIEEGLFTIKKVYCARKREALRTGPFIGNGLELLSFKLILSLFPESENNFHIRPRATLFVRQI